MFCKKCGAQLEDDTLFCANCGTKASPPLAPAQSSVESTIQALTTPQKVKIPAHEDRAKRLAMGCFSANCFVTMMLLLYAILDIDAFVETTGRASYMDFSEFVEEEYEMLPTLLIICLIGLFIGFIIQIITVYYLPYSKRTFSNNIKVGYLNIIEAVSWTIGTILVTIACNNGYNGEKILELTVLTYIFVGMVVVTSVLSGVTYIRAVRIEDYESVQEMRQRGSSSLLDRLKTEQGGSGDIWTCKHCGASNKALQDYCKDCGKFK